MASFDPLYLGFDLSTQALKGIAIASDLKVVCQAVFDFDVHARGFEGVRNGVVTNAAEHEVVAPVPMWLQAIDGVLEMLQKEGLDFSRVKGISGAGQQHGSVYWSQQGDQLLSNLAPGLTLEEQLSNAFSYPYSPNWQDASTQEQCDLFDQHLGGESELALNTGSKAHHVSQTRSQMSNRVRLVCTDSLQPPQCFGDISMQICSTHALMCRLIFRSVSRDRRYYASGASIRMNIGTPPGSPLCHHFLRQSFSARSLQ